jgi:hypothetical protein
MGLFLEREGHLDERGDEKEMEEDGENIGREGASKIVTSFWSCVQINLFSSIFPYDLASRDEELSKSSSWYGLL